jgi:hypothetical protein
MRATAAHPSVQVANAKAYSLEKHRECYAADDGLELSL